MNGWKQRCALAVRAASSGLNKRTKFSWPLTFVRSVFELATYIYIYHSRALPVLRTISNIPLYQTHCILVATVESIFGSSWDLKIYHCLGLQRTVSGSILMQSLFPTMRAIWLHIYVIKVSLNAPRAHSLYGVCLWPYNKIPECHIWQTEISIHPLLYRNCLPPSSPLSITHCEYETTMITSTIDKDGE